MVVVLDEYHPVRDEATILLWRSSHRSKYASASSRLSRRTRARGPVREVALATRAMARVERRMDALI